MAWPEATTNQAFVVLGEVNGSHRLQYGAIPLILTHEYLGHLWVWFFKQVASWYTVCRCSAGQTTKHTSNHSDGHSTSSRFFLPSSHSIGVLDPREEEEIEVLWSHQSNTSGKCSVSFLGTGKKGNKWAQGGK